MPEDVLKFHCMRIIDQILKLYSSSLSFPKWVKRIKGDSVWRHALVNFSTVLFPLLFRANKVSLRKTDNTQPVIVSLTSFPERIEKVWLTIESLMHQSVSPQKIILWLSKEQFDGLESLPKRLLDLQERGLEIRLVEGDYKSHKKYLYVFKEYPNNYVLLVDDDIIYPSDMISSLLENMAPNRVHCSYGYIVRYNKLGKVLPYLQWKKINGKCEDKELFFGSGGGTLLLPSSLPADILDIHKAIELCPLADDIWLNGMCRMANLSLHKVREGLIFPVKQRSKKTLSSLNLGKNKNDEQLKSFIKDHPNKFPIS